MSTILITFIRQRNLTIALENTAGRTSTDDLCNSLRPIQLHNWLSPVSKARVIIHAIKLCFCNHKCPYRAYWMWTPSNLCTGLIRAKLQTQPCDCVCVSRSLRSLWLLTSVVGDAFVCFYHNERRQCFSWRHGYISPPLAYSHAAPHIRWDSILPWSLCPAPLTWHQSYLLFSRFIKRTAPSCHPARRHIIPKMDLDQTCDHFGPEEKFLLSSPHTLPLGFPYPDPSPTPAGLVMTAYLSFQFLFPSHMSHFYCSHFPWKARLCFIWCEAHRD